jgi:hypothetical protein
MAKYKNKKAFIDAYFIDFSKPEQWPDGVISNAQSPTGVSYKSLEEKQALGQSVGSVMIEGIPIATNSWLVIDWRGVPSNLTNEEFNKRYEA